MSRQLTTDGFKQLSQKIVQRPQTQIAMSRHNEYNNNDEDYSKAKKDELIQNILKNRTVSSIGNHSPNKTLDHSPHKQSSKITQSSNP